MTKFIHCPLDPKGRVLSFQGEAGCSWHDVTTGFFLREDSEQGRAGKQAGVTAGGLWLDCTDKVTRSGVTVREIVLHTDNQASCICCEEIVTVHYKIIWEVASGYRVSGYLNSCFIWILRAFGAEFVDGFSDLFPLSSYYIYCFYFMLKNKPRTTDQSFLNSHGDSSLSWLVSWSFTLPFV